MAPYQKLGGACTGRGFVGVSPEGWLKKFYDWVELATGSGGPAWFIIDDQSALETDSYIVVCDIEVPVVNDFNTGQSGGAPKFMKIGMTTAEPGYIRAQYWMWWDTGSHTGYGYWGGFRIATIDAGLFSFDFRGGEECLIVQSRIGGDWDSTMIDDFTGDVYKLEGADKVGVLQDGISAGSSVMIQLDTGQAANFTLNYFYYLFDFDAHAWVNYVRITNVNTGADQITINECDQNFPSGAVISSYAHRYYACGSDKEGSVVGYSYRNSNLPYVSVKIENETSSIKAFPIQNQKVYNAFKLGRSEADILIMSPNDLEEYAVQRGAICEYMANSTNTSPSYLGQNRGYGICNNLYLTALGSRARGQDGQDIDGKDWLYFQREIDLIQSGNSSIATLFLNSTEE